MLWKLTREKTKRQSYSHKRENKKPAVANIYFYPKNSAKFYIVKHFYTKINLPNHMGFHPSPSPCPLFLIYCAEIVIVWLYSC